MIIFYFEQPDMFSGLPGQAFHFFSPLSRPIAFTKNLCADHEMSFSKLLMLQ